MDVNPSSKPLQRPVVSIVGRSNVGKTTFLVKLIEELKGRGYRVGTIKHYQHEFEIDQPGKDSWRHAQAGSDVSVIAAPHKVALVQKLDQELPLARVLALMLPTDIVLTEGYKGADRPKIEVFRKAHSDQLVSRPEELIAIVTDQPFDLPVPQFALDDAAGVADLIVRSFLDSDMTGSGDGRCGEQCLE